jgi:cyclase
MHRGLPDLRRVLADVTFEQRLTLHSSRRRAELITYGGGHTSSDALLQLPDHRVALIGDLLFVGSHPASSTATRMSRSESSAR